MEIEYKSLKLNEDEIEFLGRVKSATTFSQYDLSGIEKDVREHIVRHLVKTFIASPKFNEVLGSINLNELKNLTMLGITGRVKG